MLTVRNSFLLLHTSNIAQLACIIVIISIVTTRLGIKVAMHHGFLRAGWQSGTMSLKSSMAQPAVSISSTGGTAGSLTELCNFAMLI
jgi:hypothetical protein